MCCISQGVLVEFRENYSLTYLFKTTILIIKCTGNTEMGTSKSYIFVNEKDKVSRI